MGRHGGINILHQKSWHVWRMDNRLRVERDELQHAAQEKERRSNELKAAFEGKIAKLRRRAVGDKADVPDTSEPSQSSASSPSTLSQGGRSKAGDEYHVKYGVTLSNLKVAEAHLDRSLKSTGNRESKEGGYWGSGGLGSGPHINLFEEAELESQRHVAAHGKQLRYAEVNNDLAEKSKKRPLSEFDEIASDVPWYMQAARPAAADISETASKDEAADNTSVRCSRSRSNSRQRGAQTSITKWRRRHGQLMRQVLTDSQLKRSDKSPQQACKLDQDAVPSAGTLPGNTVQTSIDLSSRSCTTNQDASVRPEKDKKEKKKHKKQRKDQKESRKERHDRERQELAELRHQRQVREEAERRRSANLLGRSAVG